MAENTEGFSVPMEEAYWGMQFIDPDQTVTIEELKAMDFDQEMIDGYYELAQEVGEENITLVLEEDESGEPSVHMFIMDTDTLG
jgi:hypothetical protein